MDSSGKTTNTWVRSFDKEAAEAKHAEKKAWGPPPTSPPPPPPSEKKTDEAVLEVAHQASFSTDSQDEDLQAQIEELEAVVRKQRRALEVQQFELSMVAADLRRSEAEKADAWHRIDDLEKKRQEDADDLRCVICLEERRSVVFYPCGHVSCCRQCFLQIVDRDPSCPNCRQEIRSHYFVYI
eukprot:gb/GFBE01044447.1/.p1 GENE.gb/GFBE01044447.1/~~gb/GFBE01044447.1/.p1  ORF type:complete len:182 (+),score=46.20 gb/GFBE01044447.1/:1-546(+)